MKNQIEIISEIREIRGRKKREVYLWKVRDAVERILTSISAVEFFADFEFPCSK